MIQRKIEDYLRRKGYEKLALKAFLIDMDGVLYDSMPAHARSWYETFGEYGINGTTPEEFYLHEGRIASSTITLIFERELGRNPSAAEIETLYTRKTELFRQYNHGNTIPYAKEVLQRIKTAHLLPVLVTGSGQSSLLDRLNENFPQIFTRYTMVTGHDVQHGKPHPEPYLKGLEKAGNLQPYEAIAIENAPMGVESAHQAGVFVAAVNTGLLSDADLYRAGADIVFGSMKEVYEQFTALTREK